MQFKSVLVKNITPSDLEILSFLNKGNSEAIDIIYQKYWNRLFSYAYRILQDETLCEDIVQEIFIQLWENRKTTVITHLENYLFQSVKYRIANNLRKIRFTSSHEMALEEALFSNSVEEKISFDELNNSLEAAIEKLPPRCKSIFRLSRFQNLTNKEISLKLNISQRTVETQISNALKSIRKSLDGELTCFLVFALTQLFTKS